MERLKTIAEVASDRIAQLPEEFRERWKLPPSSNVNEIARDIVVRQWWDEYLQTLPTA